MYENNIWYPPLSPKDQKRLNRQRGRRWQKLAKWTGLSDKTMWDWLQLLAALAIPVVIAAGTMWFSAQQYEASTRATQDQQQENALQAYLDRISDLLLNNKLHVFQPGDDEVTNSEVGNVARTRTLTILPQLNETRKRELLLFLHEARLVNCDSPVDPFNCSGIIDLSQADFSRADLHGATLRSICLNKANLIAANLSDATDLVSADLENADLRSANLSTANLSDANLKYALLDGADLSGAYLDDANLYGAHVTDKQLKQAYSLKGATMPDGSKHP